MTKTVAFTRHAKSDWGNSNLADIDRPLAPKGEKDAPLMGQWIAKQADWQLALISPALRTRQTFEALGIDVPKHVDADLYPTQAGQVLRRLRALDDAVSQVMIVGHNPGISMAVNTLLESLLDDPKLEDFPTCACAVLQFEAEAWADLDFSTGQLKAFMTPKRLKREKTESKS